MKYLYHWVPRNMLGTTLYPLNVLKNINPELYAVHASKYEGRERVMDQVIPTLDCLWNDVLHLSAIHPQIVKDALIEAGGNKDMKIACYAIDPLSLDEDRMTVFLYNESSLHDKKPTDFVPFTLDGLEKYSDLPETTKAYYKECYAEGKRPLAFHMAPHVFYKGAIDVRGVPIVEV